jgi:general secretion pathway protein E
LDRTAVDLRLERLGFDGVARTRIREMAETANGIVLVTGPTGSGKTTTLYSILLEHSRPEVKVFSVEDPVEYRIPGVTQLQINPAIDLDFATALRSVLRQDPDIILIGEIRDRETAQIAVQAALTGHLVFSTLHTNSAAGALTRLRDMGIDGYLLGATIRGVLAQRLVRRLCSTCKSSDIGHDASTSCPTCRGRGYSGRTVVYEFLKVSPTIATMIDGGANEIEITATAAKEGLVSMADYGMSLVEAGITDMAEIRRVVDLGENT